MLSTVHFKTKTKTTQHNRKENPVLYYKRLIMSEF